MLGTAFSVYDGGLNPEKASQGSVRHELAAVEYVRAHASATPLAARPATAITNTPFQGTRQMFLEPKGRA